VEEKIVIITGASDGIGAEAARELTKKGAKVVVVGRSPEKTKAVAVELRAPYFLADFAKLSDVRKLAADLKQAYPRIDVLLNNAGGIFGTRELTEDGHEMTFQVNYLASFLLTNLLMDTLVASKASIINTSSIASARYGNIDMNDLELEKHFDVNHAYGNAKLENILFTKELHRRYSEQGISSAAVHPGVVATNFASTTTSWLRFLYRIPFARFFLDTVAEGAEPLVWLALTKPGIEWESGKYYDKHKVGKLHVQVRDEVLVKRLWEVSNRLVA
jgi:NAD(P)-dependent dehydrogenase (short-subunit alcohol dehydrogenase family)